MMKGRKPMRAVMPALLAVIALAALAAPPMPLSSPAARAAQDGRELVRMPPMMREHMLRSMREHLRTLNAMLDSLARGDVETATKLAEERLGMSSMQRHGAERLARFMPAGMRAIGLRLHRAASRFVIIAGNAELEPDRDALHATYAALKEITDACIACHDAYRLR